MMREPHPAPSTAVTRSPLLKLEAAARKQVKREGGEEGTCSVKTGAARPHVRGLPEETGCIYGFSISL